MDIFSMAAGLTKMELTQLFASTAKSSLEGLNEVQLNEEEKKQLKKLVTLASAGAVFQIA